MILSPRYSTILTALLLTVVSSIALADNNIVEQPLWGRSEEYARGWNENILWHKTLAEAQEMARSTQKPLMLLIHKTWCGACKALKHKFVDSLELQELSEQFVMVNLEDDEEPQVEPLKTKFQPDGGYIPRILFLSPEGNVLTHIINKGGNEKYRYYYPDAGRIVNSMKQVLDEASKESAPDTGDEHEDL